jgi:hypothetical protein
MGPPENNKRCSDLVSKCDYAAHLRSHILQLQWESYRGAIKEEYSNLVNLPKRDDAKTRKFFRYV